MGFNIFFFKSAIIRSGGLPRKCLGPDVANSIFYIWKSGENLFYLNHKCFRVWVLFSGVRRIFSFFLCSQHVPFMFLSMGSHQVPNMFCKFSMCSPRVFPIAPSFNPICFAQSPPFLTYIGRPKGEPFHLSIKSSILGEPSIVSTCFCNGSIKITHCKKNGWTCEAPSTN